MDDQPSDRTAPKPQGNIDGVLNGPVLDPPAASNSQQTIPDLSPQETNEETTKPLKPKNQTSSNAKTPVLPILVAIIFCTALIVLTVFIYLNK